MKEFVHHEINGLLFEHRNPLSLSEQMERFVQDPDFAQKLGEVGYLQSKDGHIPDIQEHARDVEIFYHQLIEKRSKIRGEKTRPLAHHI